MEIIIIILVAGVAIFAFSKWQQKKRREALMLKYGDARLVERIMQRMMWQGQTEGQLLDSLSKPADIDRKVMKSKTREVWKYHLQGNTNRFGLRITLEDGIVVGWDKKGQ
uniref:DUF2845 domain-containing protein n=1 Tax=Castellaniella defragrans TaxID=75697 RepID=UPI003340841A